MTTHDDREWLEPDGLGGFASGTVSGLRTRRYHALLLTATNPPTGRFVLVNGYEGFVTTAGGSFPVSSQHYAPDVVHPDGHHSIVDFTDEPWPTWTYQFPDGTRIKSELFVPHETSAVVLRWTLLKSVAGPVWLTLHPLLSGRDYHSLHHENSAFRFEPERDEDRLVWRPYDGVPGTIVYSNGKYTHEPQWYRQFLYRHEQERGLDCIEDLASPGKLKFELADGPAVCLFAAEGPFAISSNPGESAVDLARRLDRAERSRRGQFASRLDRSADAYLVRRGNGKTIVAGYPWFTDWGRDTFIALRGLCLATGRLAEAGQLLRDWATTVSQGMLPNRFPDHGDQPEFNSVDASLWYVIAVHDYFQAAEQTGFRISDDQRWTLQAAIQEILTGYSAGTRYNIRADKDGLLQAGTPGVQLTWMDAKVGDWVVTPRIGKPVEVQALWINALWIGSRFSSAWNDLCTHARKSFQRRFWNESRECLFDVIDVDHVAGKTDDSIRPNQIFAVGGLPLCLLDDDQARQVVETVEQKLLTPLGSRSLDPSAPDYKPHYRGGVWERDGAYHQGTVWPWLAGPFVEAWVRVRGETQIAKREATQRFIQPLLNHLHDAGLGHISEIVDAEPTPTAQGPQQIPGGCPFQAWSLGELIRLQRNVLNVTSGKGMSSHAEQIENAPSLLNDTLKATQRESHAHRRRQPEPLDR